MSVITITKDNFESEVLKSPVPSCWTSGLSGAVRAVCDPPSWCRSRRVGRQLQGGQINVDEQPELASQFRVMSIPTLVVMKDGAVYKSSIGMQPKASILALLDR